MAIIKPGPLIDSIAGSVGGVTFRTHHGRTVTYSKPAGPVRPGKNSALIYAYMEHAARAWTTIDDKFRRFWEYSFYDLRPIHPWKKTRFLTPYGYFMFYQTGRLLAGLGLLTDAAPPPQLFPVESHAWGGPGPNVNDPSFWSALGQPPPTGRPVAAALYMRRVDRRRNPITGWMRVFPTPEHPIGNNITHLDYFIWQQFGYPPGLGTIQQQALPDEIRFEARGFGFINDRLCLYLPQLSAYTPTVFQYPVPAPIVETVP